MKNHHFIAVLVLLFSLVLLPKTVYAGFEWLPTGQTPYADAQEKTPTMQLSASDSSTQNTTRGVGATSGQGIFLPLPGEAQATVMPRQRTSSPAITPPVSSQNPAPDMKRYTPDFQSSMPHLRSNPKPAQNAMSLRDNRSYTSQSPSSDFERVEGFGRDIPLAMALNQVVPAGYAYAFGDGVNPGYRVSWSGGKPWNEVVFDMIAPLDFVAYVRGNKLFINKRRHQSEKSMVVHTPAPSTAVSQVHVNAAHAVPVPPPIMPIPGKMNTQNNVRHVQNNVHIAKSTAHKGPQNQDGFVSLEGGRSNILDPGLHKRSQSAKTLSKIKQWTNFDEIARSTEKVRLTDVEQAQKQSAPSPIKPVMTAPVYPPPPQKFAYQTSLMENINQPAAWQARQGDSLFSVLQRWCDQANMKLIWSAQNDYLVASDVFVNGPFPQALEDLVTNGVMSGHRPAVDFYETPTEAHEGTVVIKDR
jgi:hypothetical protein